RGWGDRGEELALAQQVLVDQPPPDLLRQIRQCQRRQARPGDRGGGEAARLRLVDEEAALPVPESLDQRRRRRGAAEALQGERPERVDDGLAEDRAAAVADPPRLPAAPAV